MNLTAYQETILVWLYGLQNYQGIFANVPPPPAGIVPPVVSQTPSGQAWIAYATEAGDLATSPSEVQDMPGTAENDPQAAIAAMPDLVTQIGGTLLLTLAGAHVVEEFARQEGASPLAEEAMANIQARLAIMESAAGRGLDTGSCSAEPSQDPRCTTNLALLARAGLIDCDQAAACVLTEQGTAAWNAFHREQATPPCV